MSELLVSLVDLLQQNKAEDICNKTSGVNCRGISCSECPFYSELNKDALIRELQEVSHE